MKHTDKAAFDAVNVFGTGAPNEAYAAYFTGQSFVNPLTMRDEAPVYLANVTFEAVLDRRRLRGGSAASL
ncbi:MAG: hypothetical protein Q4G45_06045 [Actinomycetia bacterium]|nr:hypothetical protein [Actinomycetes bacterium]